MVSQKALRKVLDDAVKAAALVPAAQTAWENMQFTPVAGTPWLAMEMAARTRQAIGVMASSLALVSGTYQVAINWPQGRGAYDAEALASQVEAVFKRGTVLITSDGYRVVVDNVSTTIPVDNPPWYRVPVLVNFSVYEVT